MGPSGTAPDRGPAGLPCVILGSARCSSAVEVSPAAFRTVGGPGFALSLLWAGEDGRLRPPAAGLRREAAP
jgi:hypothetical protein